MSGEISLEMVDRYRKLDDEIRKLENKIERKLCKAKKKQIEDIEETIKALALEKHLKDCKTKTASEKADVDMINKKIEIKDYIDKTKIDAALSKEESEYLEALTEQENAEKQLTGVKQQRDDMVAALKNEFPNVEKLDKLEKEQDEILVSIFKGDYGSDLENQLERDHDMYLEKKQKIEAAQYKWGNAKVLLHHATQQMATAENCWNQVAKIPCQQNRLKYEPATITRNNLIASIQNIRNCQMYLRDIKFPYCSAEEMATLEKAVSNIYVDMQTNERISYAHRCYNTTRRRACALEQWFDNVISTIIQKDYKDAKKLEKETAKALRQERLRLMKEKLLEAGQSVEDLKEKADDFEDEEEPELMQLADCQITETDQDKQQTLSPGEENVPAPTPVPLRDLAPPPSQETIFGNIEQLKKQHEKETADFDKAQEMNKARMQQGLDEKLAARRNRRNRQSVME